MRLDDKESISKMPEQVETTSGCTLFSGTHADPAAEGAPLISVCQIIKDPARHMGPAISVGPATIVFCDVELERIDIAAEGGKLVVKIGGVEGIAALSRELRVGQKVSRVTGVVTKQARRTFLVAHSITSQ